MLQLQLLGSTDGRVGSKGVDEDWFTPVAQLVLKLDEIGEVAYTLHFHIVRRIVGGELVILYVCKLLSCREWNLHRQCRYIVHLGDVLGYGLAVYAIAIARDRLLCLSLLDAISARGIEWIFVVAPDTFVVSQSEMKRVYTFCQLRIVYLLADVIRGIRQSFGVSLVIIHPVLVRHDGDYLFLATFIVASIGCWQIEATSYSGGTILAVEGYERIAMFASCQVGDVLLESHVCLLVGLRHLVIEVIVYPVDDFLNRRNRRVIFLDISILITCVERDVCSCSPSSILVFQLDVVDMYTDVEG